MAKHEDIIRLAREEFNHAKDSDKEQRAEMEHDTRFAVNDDDCQWPDNAKNARKNATPPRPYLVTNKIPEKIDQVEGEFRQMRPSVKVRPVDSLADVKTAEILAGLVRNIEYDSSARSAYNHCHASVLYCGRGAWRVSIVDDEDDPFVRSIKIDRIPNVHSVYWDQDAKKEDLSDARRFWITDEMSELAYKAVYPKFQVVDWTSDNDTMIGWRTDKTVRVAEYWWKEKIDREFNRVNRIGANGQPVIVTIPTDKLDKMKDRDQVQIMETKIAKVDKVKWGIMNYNEFIEGPHDDWPSKYIPIIVESGKEVNIRGKFKSRGMVRFAKGPQMMLNFWNTAGTERIALDPKTPYLMTPKMMGNHQDQWDKAPTENYLYLFHEPDPSVPGGRPHREQPPQMSTAYAAELSRMEHDIMSSMGIYAASLGDQGQEKSGRAITARQRQGSIGSYTFTDKFNGALTYGTKVIIDLAPKVYDTERIIRITRIDGTEQTVPINAVPGGQAVQDAGEVPENMMVQKPGISDYINDFGVGRYDAVVTIGPSYTTQRQEAAAMILDLIQSVPKIGEVTADILIKNLDIPEADKIIERVKKLIPVEIRGLDPGEQPPEPKQDPKEMIEMQKLVLSMMEEQRKEFSARVAAIKDLAEAESKERGQQLQEFTAVAAQIREDVAAQQQNQPQPPGGGQGGMG